MTVTAKFAVGGLVTWAVAFPEQAGTVLSGFNGFVLSNFASWYIYAVALLVLL